MICYASVTDLVATQNLGIGTTQNELFNIIEVLPNFYNQIVSGKICGTAIICYH